MSLNAAAQPLTYEIEREGETAIVKCHGRLVTGVTDGFFQDLKGVLTASKVVTLDLAGLTYVDSTGLGTLTRLYVHAKSAGCELKLLHLGKQVKNLLKLTNLLSVFSSAEEHGISLG
jgi:anti-sigma B factor antagonist